MSNKLKDKILEEYYIYHNKPSQIALKYNVSKAYITKVIQKSSNYNNEKNRRKLESLIARKDYLRNYNEARRLKNKELNDFIKMQHIKASLELSYDMMK